MAGKRNRIAEEGQLIQAGLFSSLQDEKRRFDPFPRMSNDIADFRRVLAESAGPLGVDFEFSADYNATHFGIASETEAVCVKAGRAEMRELIREVVADVERRGRTIVGHSVLGAERKVIEVMTGVKVDLKYFNDTMLSHHLLNADLCGNVQKTEDKEETGSLGFMNLGVTAHMSTLLPAWKVCSGKDCGERVCPTHNKSNYCAVDAWASLTAHNNHMEEMETYGVDPTYLRDKMELAEIALEMERQGIKVDRQYVAEFEAESEERKAALFPYTLKGKERVYTVINPRSPAQVLEYFKANKVNLPSVDKKAVRKTLEGLAEKHGYTLDDLENTDVESLPTVLKTLYHLDLFKTQGKGLDPWFADKYLDTDGFLHPRFVVTGTATDRWSSSKPNLQNVPSHGAWGSLVKKAIIPREKGYEIFDCDASQLEFRNILFQLGWDAKDIPPKVFEYLVEKSNGGFKQTADFLQQEERQIAKTVVYGSLYGEGMSIMSPYELEKPRIKQEIEYGARRVYLRKYGAAFDWTYNDQVITFTGGNMAERLFRDKTFESRRKALYLCEDVLMSAFNIRKWQRDVSAEVESRGYVQCPYSGKILHLYGSVEDMIKPALSFRGQGCSTIHVQAAILRYKREQGKVPLIMVHDSAVGEFPTDWSDKKLREHLSFMFEDTKRIPGFFTPAGIKRGPSYGDMRKVTL